jgi:oligoendopeptidase F
MTQIAERPEIRWNLTGIYRDLSDPQIELDTAGANAGAKEFADRYRSKISSLDADGAFEMLERYFELLTLTYKPTWFAGLQFAADTNDQAIKVVLDRARSEAAQTQNLLVFVQLELTKLPAETVRDWTANPVLLEYLHFLQRIQTSAPYTLSEAQEQLMTSKSLTGRNAWSQLYTEITSAIEVDLDVDEVKGRFQLSQLRQFSNHPNRNVRRAARETQFKALEAQQHVLTYIFNTIYQDWKLDIELRQHSDPMEPNALQNEISLGSIEALMDSAEKNAGILQEFFRLKAKTLGISDFSSFDMLAPLENGETKYSYQEAQSLILKAFERFSPDLKATAQAFFDEARIDLQPRPGKRGGAFCSSYAPQFDAYILTNFTGTLDDVFTLAHELGHGVHAQFSKRLKKVNYGHSLPLAETASVFCEMLLMDYLLETGSDTERRALIAKQLEDVSSTCYRQIQINRWEQLAHLERAKGVVSSGRFCEIWSETVGRFYGEGVTQLPGDRWGWIGIPHVVSYRFYCYSYAFGMLMVFALYRQYKLEGASFVPKYIEFLSSGERATPEELVAKMGVNLSDPAFWQNGFDHVADLLEEFKRLSV